TKNYLQKIFLSNVLIFYIFAFKILDTTIMKKAFITLPLVSCMAVFTACKRDKENQTNAKEAETVSQMNSESIKYKINADQSTIHRRCSQPLAEPTGTMGIEAGVVTVKGGMTESGKFLLDMNSIKVTDRKAGEGKENLRAHLKGTAEGKEDHFCNVQQHPTAY